MHDNPLDAEPIPYAKLTSRPFSRRKAIVLLLAGAACLLFAVYVYRSPRVNPAFTIEAVQGLTPDEVTARFGPPVWDTRLPKWGGWTPAMEAKTGEKLDFMYYDDRFLGRLAGRSYGISFTKGHVTSVSVGEK